MNRLPLHREDAKTGCVLLLTSADPRYYPLDELEQQFHVQAVGSVFALMPRQAKP